MVDKYGERRADEIQRERDAVDKENSDNKRETLITLAIVAGMIGYGVYSVNSIDNNRHINEPIVSKTVKKRDIITITMEGQKTYEISDDLEEITIDLTRRNAGAQVKNKVIIEKGQIGKEVKNQKTEAIKKSANIQK